MYVIWHIVACKGNTTLASRSSVRYSSDGAVCSERSPLYFLVTCVLHIATTILQTPFTNSLPTEATSCSPGVTLLRALVHQSLRGAYPCLLMPCDSPMSMCAAVASRHAGADTGSKGEQSGGLTTSVCAMLCSI
jgi:hypothetical protein